ncbi:hypothetical protein N480_17625 [Pseudoalteromonas luteoviolacea S2607]|uniref:hypothetical protein n=1 Tax=Pseudoalteromonas luteoviolacea TaxID=43657 RepID=UPI0007B05385|nr:hypothetical protein [Pseudoalteromonas luteoviolacea]KZN36520.1 hypothetical protein N480_17625 [Pseudoalteromonas luteoviolacea S2607]
MNKQTKKPAGSQGAYIRQWVDEHLSEDSELLKAVSTLRLYSKSEAKQRRETWFAQDTEDAYSQSPSLAGSDPTSALNTFRNKYKVDTSSDKSSYKYKIKSVEEVNLEEGGQAPSTDEAELQTGVMVSSPLYAGIKEFPERYLIGAGDKRENYSFIVAYNAHGLLQGDKPVENALARKELKGTRGIKVGFYWDQQIQDVNDSKSVWTDDSTFVQNYKAVATSPEQRKAFVGSLKHAKVLKTFPYGMWRNIALDNTFVTKIMNSHWGESHSPVFTHITDPDASTWVDPYSKNHVSQQMALEAEAKNADLVLGAYVYDSAAAQGDDVIDRAVKVIAKAGSQMDALLRPKIFDTQGINYPAERNFMLKLKSNDGTQNLYQAKKFIQRSSLLLDIDKSHGFSGKGPSGEPTLFGLGDAEGRKLQSNVRTINNNLQMLVSSAAVTTDVPGRVKASVVETNHLNQAGFKDNGVMKPLSNIKESLVATSTIQMMKRTSSKNSTERNLAIELIRERPRNLWFAIAKAHETQGDIYAAIDNQVSTWQSEEQDTKAFETLSQTALALSSKIQKGDKLDQDLDLKDAQEAHNKYDNFSIRHVHYSQQQYQEAATWVQVHVLIMSKHHRTRVDYISPEIEKLQDIQKIMKYKSDVVNQAVQQLQDIVDNYERGTLALNGLRGLESQIRAHIS